MKKVFLLLASAFTLGLSMAPTQTKAQGIQLVTQMTDSDTAMSNTTPSYSTLTLPNGWDVVTVQTLVRRNSGTVTGTVELQASLDGINYKRCATDTFVPLNTTSTTLYQSYLWTITPSKYKYYRVQYVGVGTMNARYNAYLLYQKNED